MPTTQFVVKIENLSKVAVPLELFPRVVRPLGIHTVWAPEIIPHAELTAHAETAMSDGVTVAGFYPHLPLPYQWKQAADKSWTFQGGDIVLKLTLIIYITARYEQEPFWDDLYQLVLTHELKHWKDSIDIVTNDMPRALQDDADLKRLILPDYAGRMTPMTDKEYQEWFVATDALGDTKFEKRIGDYWSKFYEKQKRLTDSSAEYRRYDDNVYNLKNGRPQYVIWPK